MLPPKLFGFLKSSSMSFLEGYQRGRGNSRSYIQLILQTVNKRYRVFGSQRVYLFLADKNRQIDEIARLCHKTANKPVIKRLKTKNADIPVMD